MKWKPLLTLVAGLGLSASVFAAEAGKDYQVLDEPVKTDAPAGNVEVVEAFWYGCPHCYALESSLEPWVDELPGDVTFHRLPATMGQDWVKHAYAFYAAKDLGILDQTHKAFFDAIHKDHQRLTDPEDIAAFYSDYGVSEEDAEKSLTSFGVKSQVNQAHAQMRAYKIMGVPALNVDGRYVVSPSTAGSLKNMLKITDELVEQVREEKAGDKDAA
jgi:thiol:disulfide interchange protein DsbA